MSLDGQLRSFWRRAVLLAVFITGAVAAGLYFGLADGRAAALGWLLGAATSVARFALSYRVLRAGPAPGRLVRVRLLNYGLSAVALMAAFALRPAVNPLAAAVGLLAMNGAVVLTEVLWKGEALDSSASAADNP